MTPRLILLNGPPAIGKSTIAVRFLLDHPLALNLDLDRLRRFVGEWRADPLAAYRVTRDFGLAAARAHLEAGHDVVVPQYVGLPEQLDRFGAVAAAAGADYREIVLLATKDRVLARFAARTAAAADPIHTDAQQLLDAAGGTLQLETMYDRLLLVLGARPGAIAVGAADGQIEQTYADVLAAVN